MAAPAAGSSPGIWRNGGDDVKGLCDVLGIERPVVYGNSFGGMVAMAYAARHPSHPGKLILSSTAARIHLDETFRLFEARGGTEARAVAERFWTRMDEAALADYMRICMPLYNPSGAVTGEQTAARQRAILRPEVMRHFSLGEIKTMDAVAGLAAIRCPTLVLAGDYDPITPLICSQEIFAALPAGLGRLEIFPGAGHGVHRDRPDRAEKVLRDFLAA
ncbi:MAG: alpha/beta hydrolase [Rhizomicrobium sp.]